METEKVWVLTIEHQFGFNHYANRTLNGSIQALREWVDHYWDIEFPDTIQPEDIDEAVESYFSWQEREWYTLEEVVLGD